MVNAGANHACFYRFIHLTVSPGMKSALKIRDREQHSSPLLVELITNKKMYYFPSKVRPRTRHDGPDGE
jgi:hypothetical protein